MVKTLLALVLITACAPIAAPCSEATIAAELSAVTAECKLRKQTECKGYDVIDECPLAQECDSRIDHVGADCHD